MARGLKFQIKVGEGLYNPCSENKDADQLRGYCEADLHLCFRICKNPVFSWRGSNMRPVPDRRIDLLGGYLMIIQGLFYLFLYKTYVVGTHLNRLGGAILMSTHNIGF